MRRSALAVTFLALTGAVHGQRLANLGGRDQYPQFRVLSGMSGGGYGVLPNGAPSVEGAASFTTPIAFLLDGHAALSFFNTSSDRNPFRFSERVGVEDANGTGSFTIGGSYKGWRGAASFVALSKHLDSAFNLQVAPPIRGRLGVSFGVQDVAGGGGASGTNVPGDTDSSRSFFGVATYDFGHSVYGSLGVGDRRFHGAFGNVSAPITRRLRVTAEYDSFTINAGLLYGTGPLRDLGGRLSKTEADLFLGLIAGKYATLGVTVSL